ncbi:hypothetical protein [Sulfurimonas sp.]
MAVGSIGGAILVNQMTPAATSVQNAHNNRIDFQNMAAQAAVQAKEKEVEEVRPAEESHAIDPDREHQKQEADEETKRNPKQEKDEDIDKDATPPLHKLDIKV